MSTASSSTNQNQKEEKEKEQKLRVVIGLPGDNFTQAFLLSWTQALHVLWSSNKYDIVLSPGKSSYVTFARMQTLGCDVRRGKSQKVLNGEPFDIYVSIDSDVVFTPAQLVELIECTKLHPVVSGYYMMSNNKQFAVVRDWNKSHFLEHGAFPFLEIKDLESYVTSFQTVMKARQEAFEQKEKEDKDKDGEKDKEDKEDKEEKEKEIPIPPIPAPEFLKVSYFGLGFFACRKEVLDALEYPYFNRELQRIRGKDGKELVDICSEDVALCKNIEDAGFDLMLNTRLRVGHEKRIIL
jgi:hypothetical protein